MPALLTQKIEEYSDYCAAWTTDFQLTYAHLGDRANFFASFLSQLEIPPGALIGVLMGRSPDLVAALLGIWKAGAAYLPLDPLTPPDRLAFVLEDSGASFVIAEKRYASILPPGSAAAIFIDEIPDLAAPCSFPHVETRPDSLAYVLYTSGSTGKPKGVEICHAGLANVVTAIASDIQLWPGEVLLAHSSLGFDISNLELYLPLITGGSVYLADRGPILDGKRFIDDLRVSNATTILGTPTLFRLIVDAGWTGKRDLRILCGGESLSLELAKALVKRAGSVWNQYGPTEASICATTSLVDETTRRITIGRAIPNVSVRVLDARLAPVPAGEEGEIYIGGIAVARGYRNRPDLTSHSFFPDPFSEETGATLYRTGDLGRELPDGELEFVGRVDSQVKIRGYRIELEEIEELIRQYPGVDAAAVIVADKASSTQRLVAFVASCGKIPSAGLREFLKKQLPSYMLPSEFRCLDALPVNDSGKIDRVALRSTLLANHSRPLRLSPGGNDIESRLHSIWQTLFDLESLDPFASFFDLGGDSLLAVLLVQQIEKHFGQTIAPDTLIECPSVQTLAAKLMRTAQTSESSALIALRGDGSKPPLFIVHGLGGSALLFRLLAGYLPEDQPVWCLKLPSGVVADRREISVKALAAKYIAQIRTVYPSGLVHLAGHSFGGLIAFEMANQLAHKGERVGLLALLDSDRNIGRSDDARDNVSAQFLLRRWKAKLQSLFEKGAAEVIRRRLEYMKLRKRVRDAGREPSDGTSGRNFEAGELLVLSVAEYSPHTYSGDAVLFRAMDEVRTGSDSALGWAGLIKGKWKAIDVPGKHLTAFDEPNVRVLAAKLEERIAATLARAAKP